MKNELDSKDVSWEFVTEAKVVESQPCEIIYAKPVVNGNNPESYLYHGSSNLGAKILRFVGTKSADGELNPPVPIRCELGVYWGHERDHEGIFIMWRVLPKR